MPATKTNKNDLIHNYIQNMALFRFSGKNASCLNFQYSFFISLATFHTVSNLIAGMSGIVLLTRIAPPPEERKKRHCILFYLTCWQECMSYYVKRNWFWWCSNELNRMKWRPCSKKKCWLTRCSNLSFLFSSYLFAVCVRFTMNARESNIASRIKCIHQKQK